jgi:hypothetical protein
MKKEWIKWKRMLNEVSKSDMRMNTLMKLVFERIFLKDGLFDQMMVFEKAELESLKAYIMKDDFFKMNIKLPEGCGNETCSQVMAWVGPRGVSDDAANMQNFMVKNASNVSLSDVDTNLDVFENYEKELIN